MTTRAIQSKSIGRLIRRWRWQSLVRIEHFYRMFICQPNPTAKVRLNRRFVVPTNYCGIFIFVLAYILGQGQLFAEQVRQPSLSTLRRHATELKDANRLVEAATAYSKALTIDPGWVEGWWQFGTVEYDLGNFRTSRAALTTFLSFEPNSGSGWALKGLSEFELGLTRSSLADLRRADVLGIAGENDLKTVAKVHELLLDNLAREFEPAFSVAQYLCSNTNGSPLIFVGTGLTALRIAVLPKDVAVSKRDLISRTGQVVCNATAGRSEEANTQFTTLIREYPTTPQLHYLYGCFLLKNHSDAGMGQLMAELTVSPSHVPAMAQIALEYRRRGDGEKALSYAERAVKINPQNEKAQFVMGRTLVDLGRLTDGIEHLRRALALAPSDHATLWALSLAEAKSGNEKEAQRLRRKLSHANREMADSTHERQN